MKYAYIQMYDTDAIRKPDSSIAVSKALRFRADLNHGRTGSQRHLTVLRQAEFLQAVAVVTVPYMRYR